MQPDRLSGKVRNIIANAAGNDELLLSAISPWEFCKLLEKGRLGISCGAQNWLDVALDMPKLHIVPLSPRLAYQSTVLPHPFHNDPADQIIVATTHEENATLLTKDSRLLEYKHVRTLW
jgi:PIN domain nuclease of toxin-antitoxin system